MSFAPIPAQAVIAACNSYIKARDTRILRERSELIDSYVGRRGWFGFGPAATREEVEAEFADELSWINISGGLWYDKILNLRSLANIAAKTNTSVIVDAKLASLLESHFG